MIYDSIFGDITTPTQKITYNGDVERTILHMKDYLLHGGKCSQDPWKSNSIMLDFAADFTLLRT